MGRLVAATALVTSLLASLVVVGTGSVLAGIEQSGERLAGALMAAAGVIAAASVLFLVLAPERIFRRRRNRALAVVAALVGVVPPVGLAAALLVFAGLPLGSAIPSLDWPLFACGIVFALGALAIAWLGYRRARQAPAPEPQLDPMPSDAPTRASLARQAVEIDRSLVEVDENVRVRRA
jgi:hypothetical protein